MVAPVCTLHESILSHSLYNRPTFAWAHGDAARAAVARKESAVAAGVADVVVNARVRRRRQHARDGTCRCHGRQHLPRVAQMHRRQRSRACCSGDGSSSRCRAAAPELKCQRSPCRRCVGPAGRARAVVRHLGPRANIRLGDTHVSRWCMQRAFQTCVLRECVRGSNPHH
jgi:hypothetical protein